MYRYIFELCFKTHVCILYAARYIYMYIKVQSHVRQQVMLVGLYVSAKEHFFTFKENLLDDFIFLSVVIYLYI